MLKTYQGTGSLTFLENLQLLILAHQCPFTDGSVVYQARNLYSLVNFVVEDYNDTYCVQLGFSFRTNADSTNSNSELGNLYEQLVTNEQITKTKFRAIAEYNLYPNPATNIVYINSNYQNEKINLIVNDVNGKNLIQKSINIINYQSQLNLDLINGIYFIEITNANNKYTEYKKLVIAK